MFSCAIQFNQDLRQWNVSKVRNMVRNDTVGIVGCPPHPGIPRLFVFQYRISCSRVPPDSNKIFAIGFHASRGMICIAKIYSKILLAHLRIMIMNAFADPQDHFVNHANSKRSLLLLCVDASLFSLLLPII
mmetsp:Transcript_16970/g.39187  ORF Transcript_16970/g.39187 Transcript_16970/m.39187 type:complete len:131 (-) Transcript_16970:226-618(-)